MPRKTYEGSDDVVAEARASMRPRPDAAENLCATTSATIDVTGLQ